MFGNSITAEGNWIELLNRTDIRNSGFPGFTTTRLRWVIQENVIDFKPNICFWEGEINDIAKGVPLACIQENYKALLETLASNKIIPIVQSTLYQENNPKSKIKVDSLNDFLINYCACHSVDYLDVNSNGLKSEYSKDGTHINEEAYKIWAKEITNILKTLE